MVCISPNLLTINPAYLAARGVPATIDALSAHTTLGFIRPESPNRRPLRGQFQGKYGDELAIVPALTASSGETLRQLACRASAWSAWPIS